MGTQVRPNGTIQEWEGHCNVPSRYKEDECNLGVWMKMKRHQKRKGAIKARTKMRLEEIGVVWSNQQQEQREEEWEHMFGLLERFKNREGHGNVPQIHKEVGSNLGTWMLTQHQQKKKGRLNADKKAF
jgi:hypothetical protein